MKVKVISPRFVGGTPGDIVNVDPDKINVRALVRAGVVELVASEPKKRKTSRKAAD